MSKESQHRFSAKKFRVAEGQKVKLDKIDTDSGKDLSDKTIALDVTQADVSFLQEAQQKLFAAVAIPYLSSSRAWMLPEKMGSFAMS